MTIAEIIDQAKQLSLQERKELIKLLIDTLDMPVSEKNITSQSLRELLLISQMTQTRRIT